MIVVGKEVGKIVKKCKGLSVGFIPEAKPYNVYIFFSYRRINFSFNCC